jgi:hypothetical protein
MLFSLSPQAAAATEPPVFPNLDFNADHAVGVSRLFPAIPG